MIIMSDKRFSYKTRYGKYDLILIDNKHECFYPIEDSKKNIKVLCTRLNNLEDEKQVLKKCNENLKKRIDFLENKVSERSTELYISNVRNEELQQRNERQYNLLQEWGNLILERNWKKLEKIALEYEEGDKMLKEEEKASDIHISYGDKNE